MSFALLKGDARSCYCTRLQVSLLCDVFEPHVAIAFCKCNINRELPGR